MSEENKTEEPKKRPELIRLIANYHYFPEEVDMSRFQQAYIGYLQELGVRSKVAFVEMPPPPKQEPVEGEIILEDREMATVMVRFDTTIMDLRKLYIALVSVVDYIMDENLPFYEFRDSISLDEQDIQMANNHMSSNTAMTAVLIMRTVDAERAASEINTLWELNGQMSDTIIKLRKEQDILRALMDKAAVMEFLPVAQVFIDCFRELGVEPDLEIYKKAH